MKSHTKNINETSQVLDMSASAEADLKKALKDFSGLLVKTHWSTLMYKAFLCAQTKENFKIRSQPNLADVFQYLHFSTTNAFIVSYCALFDGMSKLTSMPIFIVAVAKFKESKQANDPYFDNIYINLLSIQNDALDHITVMKTIRDKSIAHCDDISTEDITKQFQKLKFEPLIILLDKITDEVNQLNEFLNINYLPSFKNKNYQLNMDEFMLFFNKTN